ncbi:Hypothetical protein AJAP_42835 (plasmid) [Amycolatopsis japonica]|uniref:Uncharacterized protein n=1 Tax=Amycolatopsis japonica TaxID=208439 RepID=A0A075V9Y1_9PSEU|nr:hypothetical protein [Amycolatopsis japonica]AIG81334.1 Hypothetical protein AJAP_42835 [Amycolatopsis japonica]
MYLYVVPTGPKDSGFIGIDATVADEAIVRAYAKQYEDDGHPCLVIPGRPGVPKGSTIEAFQGFPAMIYRAIEARGHGFRLARHRSVVITGDGVAPPYRISIPSAAKPPVTLARVNRQLVAYPVIPPDPGFLPYRFGEAFLWSDDPRWSRIAGQRAPIPLFDYTEPA